MFFADIAVVAAMVAVLERKGLFVEVDPKLTSELSLE